MNTAPLRPFNLHFRFIWNDDNTVEPRGGVTVHVIPGSAEGVILGCAVCSYEEGYVKKEGANRARGRALQSDKGINYRVVNVTGKSKMIQAAGQFALERFNSVFERKYGQTFNDPCKLMLVRRRKKQKVK